MTAPVDIVFEILLWLPVMSLLRFKSVCESWRGLIENRRFIAQHMNHHSRVGDCVILVKRRPTKDDADSIFLLPGENNFEEAPQIQDLPPYIKDDSDLQLVAYCRGIICLYDKKYGNLSLWNPATREFRALPLLPVVFPPVLRQRYIRIRHGLGFDVKTNDFKVVRIIVFAGECGTVKEQVEVYNLSSNSWRIIHPSFPPNYKIFIHGKDPKVELNGMYSWLVRNNCVFDDVVIVSFDFVNEVLQVMELPDDCRENWTCNNYLAVLNNEPKIALIWQVGDYYCYDFEIWVLNEFGVKESWAKVYTFGPFSTSTRLVGFSKNDEVILFNREGQLALCNLITKEIKNLYMPLERTSLDALVYKESLATLYPLTAELNCSTQ